MDEEGFGWPLPGVANEHGLIQYFPDMPWKPQNAANADVMAISCQGLSNFYATIYQSHASDTIHLARLIDHVSSL